MFHVKHQKLHIVQFNRETYFKERRKPCETSLKTKNKQKLIDLNKGKE
jgi:hypothetical protein